MMRNRGRGAPAAGAGRGERGGGRGGGRGRGQSAAQLLLQKASTQLRGERVPIKPREEDELASYLNSLTQKTSQQTKSVNYEEFGDISISSGADPMTPRVARTPSPAIGAGSKFLKKKTQPAAESAPAAKKATSGGAYGVKAMGASSSQRGEDDNETAYFGARDAKPGSTSAAQTPGPKFASSSVPTSAKRGGFQMSSALNKATALANKITQRSSGSAPFRKSHSTLLESDTDESLGSALRGSHRESKGSRPGSASDHSVGHDGNKFMKKRGEQVAEVKAEDAAKGSRRQSPARAAAKEKPAVKKPVERRGSAQRAGSSVLHGSTNVYLTSEEESLAEFIQGLSGSDESRRSQQRGKQVGPKTKGQSLKSPSPNRHSRRRSPSPSPTPPPKPRGRSGSKHIFHRVSSQDSDSITSEVVVDSNEKIIIADSISLDEPLEINLMDANTLGPIVLNTPEPASYSEYSRKSSKIRSSPFKKSRSPSPSQKKKTKGKDTKASKRKKEKKNSVFESFGIQSVEDLLGGVSDKENTDSEIPTEPIQSKRRLQDQSTSQIVTEIHSRGTPQRQVSYSEDFEASISERIGDDKSRGRWARKASASSITTQYSDEETGVDYTEDFGSETLSVAKDSESERSSHYRYSDEETEASETISDRSAQLAGKREKKVVVETHSVEIQTAAPAGLSYQWMSQTGVSVLGPSLGLDHVDPTPIAATVINPDALEAMTAYSPATLAIHEMLKQQIELIQQFAQAHERLYRSLTDSNVPDYKYTTLEGTKEFIRKHRKPRLTMKEALKMVAEEMDR